MAHGLDGREVAWPGAREDLRDGVLRVLHDRSFIDDPTRMLRLVRYAAPARASRPTRTRRR